MHHPFGELLGLTVDEVGRGTSRTSVRVTDAHKNPNGVVHGGVLYALADTGMGAALQPGLAPGKLCATIDIHVTYYRSVTAGLVRCDTETVHRGRTVVGMVSHIWQDQRLVALAHGNFSVFDARD